MSRCVRWCRTLSWASWWALVSVSSQPSLSLPWCWGVFSLTSIFSLFFFITDLSNTSLAFVSLVSSCGGEGLIPSPFSCFIFHENVWACFRFLFSPCFWFFVLPFPGGANNIRWLLVSGLVFCFLFASCGGNPADNHQRGFPLSLMKDPFPLPLWGLNPAMFVSLLCFGFVPLVSSGFASVFSPPPPLLLISSDMRRIGAIPCSIPL